MVTRPAPRQKLTRTVRLAAWGTLAAGGLLLGFSLWDSPPGGIPGWQPANAALEAALSTESPQLSPKPTVPASASATAATDTHSPESAPPAAAQSPEPTPPAAARSAKPTSPVAAAPNPALLDLNKATAAELDTLPGIGDSKARSIVAYREANRGFDSVDELLEVKGIGPKLLDKIRPHVFAGGS